MVKADTNKKCQYFAPFLSSNVTAHLRKIMLFSEDSLKLIRGVSAMGQFGLPTIVGWQLGNNSN